ncbi:MAG: QueT transporter family protein [Candidatus Korarchaeota archaeon NZ13-K]|nr:MAG: QueT transporter family protein [Candidatus Korarchaeota archaeon NZ13-K]
MEMRGFVMNLALTSVFAALYATITIVLAPISFYAIQVRISDSLLALSLLFGPPVIIGTSIGCFIANLIGPFGIVDALGGSLANLVATYLGWRFRRRRTLAIMQMPFTVSLIVSLYLYELLNLPPLLTFAYLLIGSLISIGGLGSLLLRIVSRWYVS